MCEQKDTSGGILGTGSKFRPCFFIHFSCSSPLRSKVINLAAESKGCWFDPADKPLSQGTKSPWKYALSYKYALRRVLDVS